MPRTARAVEPADCTTCGRESRAIARGPWVALMACPPMFGSVIGSANTGRQAARATRWSYMRLPWARIRGAQTQWRSETVRREAKLIQLRVTPPHEHRAAASFV